MMTGKELKKLCESKGLSLPAAAKLMGVAKHQLSYRTSNPAARDNELPEDWASGVKKLEESSSDGATTKRTYKVAAQKAARTRKANATTRTRSRKNEISLEERMGIIRGLEKELEKHRRFVADAARERINQNKRENEQLEAILRVSSDGRGFSTDGDEHHDEDTTYTNGVDRERAVLS